MAIGEVRLVGGSNDSEGRVEVYYQGAWGTICDDSWDDHDARVVCRQLRLPYDNAEAFSGARFGNGSGLIQLNDVDCSGREYGIKSCKHSGWRNNSCGHSQDAGVRCGKLNMEMLCVKNILRFWP